MAYVKQEWKDYPDTTTPFSAERMEHIEDGIEAVDTGLETKQNNNGWISLNGTFTYSSADSPTFVMTTSVDLTGIVGLGMRIKLTQATTKYFIVTAITNDSITMYGGTDYTLTNASISDVYYSNVKAPYGFPMNPDKWSVSLINTNEISQTAAVMNTWYNLGGLFLDIPIGLWNVKMLFYGQSGFGSNTPGNRYCQSALSTSNNSASDTGLLAGMAGYGALIRIMMTKENIINLTSKTRYYCIARALATSGGLNLYFIGTEVPTTVKAVCAYL